MLVASPNKILNAARKQNTNGGCRWKNKSPPPSHPQKSEPIKKIALVALASDQYCGPRWRIAPSTDLVLTPAGREISIFLIVGPCINRRPSPDLRLSYDYLQFSYGLAMFLLCFRLILIVGPRPIFGYLMISYGFVWFSYGFAMFPIDFNRRASPDQRLSCDFLWFSIGFLMVLSCFRLILIVGPRPIFDYLMISYCFSLVFLWCCYVSGWF